MYEYHLSVNWSEGKKGILSVKGKESVTVATPPEFGGPEGYYSPEDLFVAAELSCFMTTFLAMAQKVRADFISYRSTATGILEKEEGGLRFTKIIIKPQIIINDESQEKSVEKALQLAKKYCLISRSVKADISLEPEIVVEEKRPD